MGEPSLPALATADRGTALPFLPLLQGQRKAVRRLEQRMLLRGLQVRRHAVALLVRGPEEPRLAQQVLQAGRQDPEVVGAQGRALQVVSSLAMKVARLL